MSMNTPEPLSPEDQKLIELATEEENDELQRAINAHLNNRVVILKARTLQQQDKITALEAELAELKGESSTPDEEKAPTPIKNAAAKKKANTSSK